MVRNATSLTGSGIRDWLLQRVSAVVLAIYSIIILSVVIIQKNWAYEDWHAFFNLGWVKIFSFIALLSVLAHAWIGMWTVFTDYISCSVLRLCLQVLLVLLLLVLFVKGILIIWGL